MLADPIFSFHIRFRVSIVSVSEVRCIVMWPCQHVMGCVGQRRPCCQASLLRRPAALACAESERPQTIAKPCEIGAETELPGRDPWRNRGEVALRDPNPWPEQRRHSKPKAAAEATGRLGLEPVETWPRFAMWVKKEDQGKSLKENKPTNQPTKE